MTFRAIIALLGGWRASAFALVAMLALSCAGVQTVRLSHLQAKVAGIELERSQAAAYASEQATKASEAARSEEQTKARYIAGIDAAYQRGFQDAQHKGDAVATGLRTGSLHFKRLWQECTANASGGVPGVAAGTGQPDAGADDRAASAGRIIGAGAKADQQIRCLQAVVRLDRGLPPESGDEACETLR